MGRIEEIKKELEKFEGLKISKFAYCEYSDDYIKASYFNNSIEACIEVTKNKLKYQKEHRQLNILHSYILELIDLNAFDQVFN